MEKANEECKSGRGLFVTKINLMHCLYLIYFVKQPLHVSGVFVAHHQEVFTVYVQQFVRVISGQAAGRVRMELLYIYSEYLLMMGNKYARNM
jgi:hypothetical protein